MHVLYFHQHFTTREGSSGTRSYEFARALVEHGHQVTVVCGQYQGSGVAVAWDPKRKWSRGNVDGIDVISLPVPYSNHDSIGSRALKFLRFGWRSVGIAVRSDYDLLFATSTPLTASLPGIASKILRRGKPFVFEVRDLWPELPRALGMRNPMLLGGMSLLEWMSYRTADACVGLAPGIVDGIKRRAPTGRRVTMIPNGCDLEVFKPMTGDEAGIPGTTSGDFVAGFTGAHGVANGLDAIVDAAAELRRRGRNDIKLVFVGDGKCKAALAARAKAEDLSNCRFFPTVKKAELAKWTARFDCGLMILANVPAFYFGTSPNKFFDYISAGIPVLVNHPGWLAGLIRENDCGVVVEPGNPGAMADALESMADNVSRCDLWGANARKLAERSFDRRQQSDSFVRFIESCV